MVKLAKNRPISVRFIEFMPFSGNEWKNGSRFVSMREILRKIGEEFGENIEFVQERKLRLPLSREKSFFYQKFLTDFKLKAIFRIIIS